ncbi:hypothetical protein C1H46_027437 [Malus baccata]|uniref:Uncharacterized protein n=1 Tax=Malus baccata TaxID=106549 RepID=A0A540LKY0_MALBA|nr:hypothetical protein C1H46_027437 [Malus baccata]
MVSDLYVQPEFCGENTSNEVIGLDLNLSSMSCLPYPSLSTLEDDSTNWVIPLVKKTTNHKRLKQEHDANYGSNLPTKDKLKTTFDKVKDFFGDAKESFGKLTTLNLSESEESEGKTEEQGKQHSNLRLPGSIPFPLTYLKQRLPITLHA